MKSNPSSISLCRHCQHYYPEGRRGGMCNKLNVAVKSRWQACNLATPPFISPWQELESIVAWKQKALIQEALSFPVVVAELEADRHCSEPKTLPISVAKRAAAS